MDFGACGFNITPHKAGVNVNATKAEIITETATVKANCLYNTPVKPPMKATGTNTEINTKAIPITGP